MGKFILISGGDEYSVKSKARDIVAGLCGENFEDNPSLETISADGDNEKKPHLFISECVSTLLTPPFLGTEKTVWLKNISFEALSKATGTEKGDLAAQSLEKLKEVLSEEMPSYLSFIMSGPGIDRRSTLYKFFQKYAEIHFLAKADVNAKGYEETVKGAIHDYCGQCGIKIFRDALEYLAMSAGGDGGRIRSEVDKLSAFISPRKDIGIEDCVKVCSRTPETSAWAYSNAISGRRLGEAISALKITLDSTRNAEMGVLYSLIGTFGTMLAAKNAAALLGVGPGCSYDAFAARLKDPRPEIKEQLEDTGILNKNPYHAYMILKASGNFSDAEIADIMSELLSVNKSMVSGSIIPDRILLEHLTVRICAGRYEGG